MTALASRFRLRGSRFPAVPPPVVLEFETLADNPDTLAGQRALDELLDSPGVRPLARLATYR